MGLQWVTRVSSRLPGITGGYKGLQGVTRGYRRLPEVTGGYKGLQEFTGGYTGLRGVGGYRVHKRLQGLRQKIRLLL